MQTINAGIHHIQVGDVTVTALNDGAFEASTDFVVGPPKETLEALQRERFLPLPPWITISCFLLSFAGRHVLVDSGSGSAMGPAHGKARAHLATLGITPAAIDTVLVTHAHIDHVSGLIDDSGAAYYPNAELVMHEAEPKFWLNADIAAKAPEAAKGAFATAAKCLSPYATRTRTVTDGQEGLPGISALHLPGHTPGHTGWLIASGGDSLLIWGDVVHLPGIQFARPDAGLGFDTDVELGRSSRARAFDMAASQRLRVAGMHLDFPLFGHVAKAASGYAFVPEVWKVSA